MYKSSKSPPQRGDKTLVAVLQAASILQTPYEEMFERFHRQQCFCRRWKTVVQDTTVVGDLNNRGIQFLG